MSENQNVSLSEIMEGLNRPTPKKERRYRIGRVLNEESGLATVLTYIDARYVMDVLDEVVGTDKWSSEFMVVNDNLFCKLTITNGSQSVSKMDVGVPSNFEGEKGEVSDALKRCAVQFGIGRDLYDVETTYVDCERTKTGQWVLPHNYGASSDFYPSEEEIKSARANMDLPCFDEEQRRGFEEFLLGSMTLGQWTKLVKKIDTQVSNTMSMESAE